MMEILLASSSPRRRELLKMIIPSFKIVDGKEVEEDFPSDMNPEDVPVFLSKLKANPYIPDLKDNQLLITADTIVILDNEILGKPHSRENAIEMLSKMQNKTHKVVTGVTITSKEKSYSFSNLTEVDFDSLSCEEIIHYVDNFKPYDKAGAYGIQEWIGAAAIIGIRGSFYNVMGLPIHSLYKAFKEIFRVNLRL